jgi:hypothetical protein
MLLGIYLEEGNYGRSQALLEETFNTRARKKDESIRTYFAPRPDRSTASAAPRSLSQLRHQSRRLKLPAEANADLDRVRTLLERLIAQAKEISTEQGRSYDALALQEDVLGIRLSLARNETIRRSGRRSIRRREKRWRRRRFRWRHSVVRRRSTPSPTNSEPFATTTTQPEWSDRHVIRYRTATALRTEPQLVSTGSLSGRETKRVTPLTRRKQRPQRDRNRQGVCNHR